MNLSPLSHAAGVLDAAGCFVVRRGPNGITTVYVKAKVDMDVGAAIVKSIGGQWSKGYWWLPAGEQDKVLRALLPHMKSARQTALARVVLSFRLTQPARRVGWEVSAPVKAFRERKAEEAKKVREDGP
ncbi:MAG: hypothetical protein V3S43_06140 [Acidimicrobiia bacterium]